MQLRPFVLILSVSVMMLARPATSEAGCPGGASRVQVATRPVIASRPTFTPVWSVPAQSRPVSVGQPVASSPSKITTSNYAQTYGDKFSHGYRYHGNGHTHWTKTGTSASLKCRCWYCPSTSCWYYWSAKTECFYPISYAGIEPPTPTNEPPPVSEDRPKEKPAPKETSSPKDAQGKQAWQ